MASVTPDDIIGMVVGRTQELYSALSYTITSDPDKSAIVLPVVIQALLALGKQLSSYSTLSASDTSGLYPEEIIDCVDIAEYYMLNRAVNAMSDVDERLGPHSLWTSQYPERIRKRSESIQKDLRLRGLTIDNRLEFDKLIIRYADPED